MIIGAVPSANLTIALDLCVDLQSARGRDASLGIVEEPVGCWSRPSGSSCAEKGWWACLGASWWVWREWRSWRQNWSGWRACAHRSLSGPDGKGLCEGPVLLWGLWVEGSAEETWAVTNLSKHFIIVKVSPVGRESLKPLPPCVKGSHDWKHSIGVGWIILMTHRN